MVHANPADSALLKAVEKGGNIMQARIYILLNTGELATLLPCYEKSIALVRIRKRPECYGLDSLSQKFSLDFPRFAKRNTQLRKRGEKAKLAVRLALVS